MFLRISGLDMSSPCINFSMVSFLCVLSVLLGGADPPLEDARSAREKQLLFLQHVHSVFTGTAGHGLAVVAHDNDLCQI